MIRAALESIAYQVRDVLALMAADAGVRLRYVRADGLMVHTTLHTVHPNSESFSDDLRQSVSVYRALRGLRKARLAAIGARPNAFATVRYSEKLLQDHGISVSTLDLSEVLGAAKRMADRDARVQRTLAEIGDYASTEGVPAEPLLRMAKFALVVAIWMDENSLDTTAVQCWNSIQRNYGINPCTVMSMMSEKLMPSACEVDVTGAVFMDEAHLQERFRAPRSR